MVQSKNVKNEWIITNEIFIVSEIEVSSSKKNDVSIISEKAYREAKESPDKGFCHNRFQPNLVVSMSSDEEEQMKVGVELDMDGVKLFVLDKMHRCHTQCSLYMANRQPCKWTNHIYYAGIRIGGRVYEGCKVYLNPLN